MAARDAGAHLWERTDLTPADVDVAELYDGFSFLAMTWLEALGFCGKGESGPFVEGGGRIALDGELPAQHPRRPAVGRPAARVRLRPRGVRAAAGRRRRPPGARLGRGGGGGQRRRPDRRRDAPHPGRLSRMPFDIDDLVRCLDLVPVEPGVVEGQNLDIGYHRVFGGQILAQVISAASSASPDKSVKSLTLLFPARATRASPCATASTGSRTVARSARPRWWHRRTARSSPPPSCRCTPTSPGSIAATRPPDVGPPEDATLLDMPMVPWEVRAVGGVDLSDRAVGPARLELWMRAAGLQGERSGAAGPPRPRHRPHRSSAPPCVRSTACRRPTPP